MKADEGLDQNIDRYPHKIAVNAHLSQPVRFDTALPSNKRLRGAFPAHMRNVLMQMETRP